MWARGIKYPEICAEFEDMNLRPNNISRHMTFSGLTRNYPFRLHYRLMELVDKNLDRIGRQMKIHDIIKAVRLMNELDK